MSEISEQMKRSEVVSRKVARLLHGEGPEVQGMVLVEMVAIWVAGHPKDMHRRLTDIHCDGVFELAGKLHARRLKRGMT